MCFYNFRMYVNSYNLYTKNKKNLFLQDCVGKVQSVFQSVRSPSKPRSPLSDSSTTLIQEGNESDAAHPDMPKLKKGECLINY